ncbi:hypothetical protein M404DRAFT_11308 [Pisolithus tinctorius Marx 270]|uniref:Uncharacterized protein n=1 Tax=Pisolithus tinctorius Marx 270 TaxID=870435 RepID=A0A0C3IB66_PISTI|nr:hypothetical protein M404DRAFT_11308 [Pisolithus tinctorius Marx 270]
MDGRVSAVNEIVAMIFSQYATFLQMEESLAHKGPIRHQLTQTKLLSVFGQLKQDDDEDSNPKGKGKAKARVQDDEGDDDGGQEDMPVGDDRDDDDASGGDMSEACDRGEQENADMNITREQRVERRARAKEQAAAHRQLLAKEAETAIMYLNAVEKPPKIAPKDFGVPTDRLSKLPSHVPKNIFRGQEFVVHHTYEWANQLPNSKKRFMRQLACLAIYEHAICLDRNALEQRQQRCANVGQDLSDVTTRLRFSFRDGTTHSGTSDSNPQPRDIASVICTQASQQIELEKLMDSFHRNRKGPVADLDCMDVEETHDDNMSGHGMNNACDVTDPKHDGKCSNTGESEANDDTGEGASARSKSFAQSRKARANPSSSKTPASPKSLLPVDEGLADSLM